MKNLQVKTRSGKIYNVRLIAPTVRHQYLQHGVYGSDNQPCEIDIDGTWYRVRTAIARRSGETIPAIEITQYNKEAQTAFETSLGNTFDKSNSAFIPFVEDWRPLWDELVSDREAEWRQQANEITISVVKATYHSNHKWYIVSCDLPEGVDSGLLKYNAELTRIKSILNALSSHEDRAQMTQYITGSNYDDYNSWDDYEFPVEVFAEYSERAGELALKAEEKKLAKEQAKQKSVDERKEIEENELFLWDAGVIYSSAGNKMLHSLGAQFSKETISIYTTGYAKDIPNAQTTHTIKDKLKALGLEFNSKDNNWVIPRSEENASTVIHLLKEHDTKAWPSDVGMVRCWECGTYFRPKRGDHDGFDYYCGC